AATGFTHHAQRLAAAHRVGHPVDSLNDARGRKKVGLKIIDFEHRWSGSRPRSATPFSANDPAHNVTPSRPACSVQAQAGDGDGIDLGREHNRKYKMWRKQHDRSAPEAFAMEPS